MYTSLISIIPKIIKGQKYSLVFVIRLSKHFQNTNGLSEKPNSSKRKKWLNHVWIKFPSS